MGTTSLRVVFLGMLCVIVTGSWEVSAGVGWPPPNSSTVASATQSIPTRDAQVYLVQGVQPPRYEGPSDTWVFDMCIQHGQMLAQPQIRRGQTMPVPFSVQYCGNKGGSFDVELFIVTCPLQVSCQMTNGVSRVDALGFHTADANAVSVSVPFDAPQNINYHIVIKGVSSNITRYHDLYFTVLH
jgi:hypothetical protein